MNSQQRDKLRFKQALGSILSQVEEVLSRIDEGKAVRFSRMIREASRIFLVGQGRSGLITRCFAMRLMHLGLSVYVVGETVTPGIKEGDLLIACSASGRKHPVTEFAHLAREKKALICALTTRDDSPLAKLSHLVIKIPGKNSLPGQPLGSLFEECLFFYLEGMIPTLMEKMGVSEEEMRARHANLE